MASTSWYSSHFSRFPLAPPRTMRWLLDAGESTVAGEESFDAHMIIILLALVCALICALAINSFLRCTLRLRRASEPTATSCTGLKRRALKGIPAAAYGPELDTPATECAICLGEFADGEKVRVLPRCNHGFHVGCIDTWLASRSSCPTCRRSLLER